MFWNKQRLLIFFFFAAIQSELILLPKSLLTNQSLPSSSSSSSVYLCYLYQLKNSKEIYLRNYEIVNPDENRAYIHHLLVYECSIDKQVSYAGLCGMYNVQTMPKLIYQSCQTRIIIAWAKGGQLTTKYPEQTGLKLQPNTQFLLEVHFEPLVLSNHSIGINLEYYPSNEIPRHEIGVLTLGTLAKSPMYLPPRLTSIEFPTYCFHDCLQLFMKNLSTIRIFSILVHAHKRARRIHLYDDTFRTIIDRNPFVYHRQEMFYFRKPYPTIQSSNQLTLICSYSTENDFNQPILGGYNSNDEMCQAFLYYYPKIAHFPLCLSVPLYPNRTKIDFHSQEQSLIMKKQLDSNRYHLSMCGDNLYSNETIFHMKIYQHSKRYSSFSIHYYSSFYVVFLCFSFVTCYLIIKQKKLTFFF